MELSAGQQRLLFAVVVVLLAGLGIYLVGPATHRKSGASPAASASSPGPPAQTAVAAPTALPTVPAASASGGADIYQWLPFTQQDLTAAARATTGFAADYETFSYTETAAAYAAKMSGVVTSELAATLQNGYATAGVAAQRSAQKQISASSGAITAIRSFGTGSITFLVNITRQLATTKNTSTSTTQYAVTVVPVAGGWEVNDIELANAGNS